MKCRNLTRPVNIPFGISGGLPLQVHVWFRVHSSLRAPFEILVEGPEFLFLVIFPNVCNETMIPAFPVPLRTPARPIFGLL